MDYAKSFTSEGTQIYFGNVLDCFGAYHDQIIALDWSTYPIKVVKCMALAQARRQILGALEGLREAEPFPPPHRQNRPRHILQLRITAFHLAQTAGSTQASLRPDMPCSNISKVQICKAVSQPVVLLSCVCTLTHFSSLIWAPCPQRSTRTFFP